MDDKTRRASVRVGAFVLVALGLLVVGSLWVAGGGLFRPDLTTYRVLMEDSGGIGEGDRVRLAGVGVGRILRIHLRADERWPVMVEIALRPDLELHRDATAVIASEGILGANFLQIEPGSAALPRLPAGGTIEGRRAPDMEQALARVDELSSGLIDLIDRAAAMLDQVSANLDPILSGAQAMLSAENTENLRGILATLRGTLDDSGPRMTALAERLESIAIRLDEGLEPLPELTRNVAGLIEDLQGSLGPDGARVAAVLDAAESGLLTAEEAMAVLADNRHEIEATLSDLRDAAANLKAFSVQVKERPYSLVRKSHEPDRKPGEGVDGGKR